MSTSKHSGVRLSVKYNMGWRLCNILFGNVLVSLGDLVYASESIPKQGEVGVRRNDGRMGWSVRNAVEN